MGSPNSLFFKNVSIRSLIGIIIVIYQYMAVSSMCTLKIVMLNTMDYVMFVLMDQITGKTTNLCSFDRLVGDPS